MVMSLLAFSGCGNKDKAVEEETTAPTEETTVEETEAPAQESILNQMAGEFDFTSGVGGWISTMNVNADGTFTGEYTDSEMGEMDAEYPDGTVYYCNFSGKISEPVQKSEFVYEAKVTDLQTAEPVGVEKIDNKIRYVSSTAYGLDDVDTIEIYLPGVKTADLPAEYVEWCIASEAFMNGTPDVLPFYGIYNVNAQEGWFSGIR